ncbi:MAG: hypothetical protein H7288_12795 [Kineosporiaceae bacterium]|nr:hypothetical protein [Aeromicrobium sp.]
MGGYNTFCEIISFDKPALIVPRVKPREEELIRARRATECGLNVMLLPEEAEDAKRFAAALKALPKDAAHRADWIGAMVVEPILIQRPILTAADGTTVVGRDEESLSRVIG